MATTEKFLFHVDFDEPPAPPAPDPLEEEAPLAPTFTEEQLAAARDEAYRAGLEAGRQEERQSLERSAADSLRSIAVALADTIETIDGKAEEIERASLKAAVDVARKLVPSLSVKQAQVEVESIIGQCLERLREEPRIVVRVADAALDQIKSRLDDLAESRGFEGRIVLLAQPDFQPSEVKVEWADGGAERNLAQIWAGIDATLERALEAAPSRARDINRAAVAEAESSPLTGDSPGAAK